MPNPLNLVTLNNSHLKVCKLEFMTVYVRSTTYAYMYVHMVASPPGTPVFLSPVKNKNGGEPGIFSHKVIVRGEGTI